MQSNSNAAAAGLLNEENVKSVTVKIEETGDNSVGYFNLDTLSQLQLFKGDFLLANNHNHNKSTSLVALKNSEQQQLGTVKVNKTVSNNIGVTDGQTIQIQIGLDVENLKQVQILPFKECLQGFQGDLFQTFLQPYFKDQYRPISKNDVFDVKNNSQTMLFKVVDCIPYQYGIVVPSTKISTEGSPLPSLQDHTPSAGAAKY